MYSFTISLLLGAAAAVRIQDGAVKTSWEGQAELISNLADKIEEQVTQGAISVVDKDNIGDIDHDAFEIPDALPVRTPAEQIESVIEQVKEGFELIAEINDEAEKKQIKKAQRKQKKEIDEVMDDANDDAAEIIEDESDPDDAADEVEDVMEDAADDIQDINKDHDEQVATIAKTTFVADITNDTVKDKILREIVDAAELGLDVNGVIKEQHLPFNVQAPLLQDEDETPEQKLDRIVCRSGDCLNDIKSDPEFDSFIGQVLQNFDDYKTAPEFASGDFYYNEEEYLPDQPEVPEAMTGPKEIPEPIGQPERPAQVGDVKAIEDEKPRRFENPGKDLGVDMNIDKTGFRPSFSYTPEYSGHGLDLENGLDVDMNIDKTGFRPSFSYTPEYSGHGLDLDSLRIEEQSYGQNLYGGFVIPELNITEQRKRRQMPKDW